MTIAIDFVGTNTGSGTKTYNINFCNELESISLKENIIVYLSKEYFKQLNFNEDKNSKIQLSLSSSYFISPLLRL